MSDNVRLVFDYRGKECPDMKPSTQDSGCIDDRLRQTLMGMDTADISDATDNLNTMSGLSSVAPSTGRVVGRAVTVSCPNGGVNRIKMAADLAGRGDILVVSTRGLQAAVIGGNLAEAMLNRGLVGVIVDGYVRDADDIRSCGMAVFARGEITWAAQAEAPGLVNVPVSCGGVVVQPGDIVVADSNGVVVIPRSDVDGVVKGTEAVQELHGSWRKDIEQGKLPGVDKLWERVGGKPVEGSKSESLS